MIFVSSSCVQNQYIVDSVRELINAGFRNIELSGGTERYLDLERDLISLKANYQLRFQLHNYFPPPPSHFMLNLASLNDGIFRKSIELCKQAITLSAKVGGTRYGVHAGFLMDFSPREAGKKIPAQKLNSQTLGLKRFGIAWAELELFAKDHNVKLYVENNVLSKKNFETFDKKNPFLLADYNSFLDLRGECEFNILCDVAHLYVSCNTLGLDFAEESSRLLGESDYIHVSDNNGFEDQNNTLESGSKIVEILKIQALTGKTITLEIYGDVELLQSSRDKLNTLLMAPTDLIRSSP